jgi:hypothetical protein
MFGNKFEAKVRAVLEIHFLYKPGHIQASTLKQIVRHAKSYGNNEYDAAIFFMIVQMNSLLGNDDRVQSFIHTHSENVRRIMDLAFTDADEIHEMLHEVASSHGITTESKDWGAGVHLSFEDWLTRFKVECGRHRPELAPDEGGASIIDFLDKEPLRRAHRDGQSPEAIGEGFAKQFDIRNLGG